MNALAHSFISNLASGRGSVTAELEAALTQILEVARESWKPIAVNGPTFAVYLAKRVPEDAEDLGFALESMHTNSLYLACACSLGDEGAIRRFEAEFFDLIAPSLKRLDTTGTIVDEATQTLRERLFVATPERAAKVGSYAGRGDLRKWVRAAAVRIGLDLLRTNQNEQRRQEDGEVLEAIAHEADDPGLAHLRAHYGDALRRSFAASLDALSDKERTALRYHYVDKLNIEQIGALHRVHKTTAFRQLEKARKTLIESTREHLRGVLGIERAELDSVMRLIKSDLNLSIQRLLKEKG